MVKENNINNLKIEGRRLMAVCRSLTPIGAEDVEENRLYDEFKHDIENYVNEVNRVLDYCLILFVIEQKYNVGKIVELAEQL